MLSSARLDRIASLAHSLRRWVQEDTLSDGDLILAWANLGALMEGALKLFLCVYLADYRADETTRETRAWHIKRQVLQDPDELMLDTILAYAEKAELLAPQQIALGRTVQARRNAIHAFRDRDLGSLTDLFAAIRDFRALLCSLNGRMEYPEPRYMPTVVADKTTAITVVYSILAALFHRERTGIGQEIEVPMFETMVSFVMAEHLWGETFEPPLDKAGYTRLMSYHRKPYKTKDGYIAVLPYMNNHWRTFCEKAGRQDLIDDERFKDLASRVANIDETYEETGKILATKTTQEWLDIFEDSKVPVNVVNSLQDLFTDPHLDAVGFWTLYEHPSEGLLKMPGFPARFSETPASIRRHPPKLGEHSVEILEEAGLDEETIQAMLESKASLQSEN